MNSKYTAILDNLRRVRALAQNGLAYSDRYFDRERYQELYDLSTESIATLLESPSSELFIPHDAQTGYATPKVGCRGALFRDDKVLLVRERSDGKWALPGGWIDVNDSPQEGVIKEFVQETGLTVRPVRLCWISDGRKHGYASAHHVYTFVFLCEYISGDMTTSYETSEVRYFPIDNLPELSRNKTIPEYINAALTHYRGESVTTECD
jgi:ADP-ribose pyrophosphatase YjhB (NUDIX family)